METIDELLDQAKKICRLANDKDLAHRLHVGRTAVSNYRNGVSLPDEVVCSYLAEMTGIPLARVLGIVGEKRAKSHEAKMVWRRLANAAALAGLVIFSQIPTAQASVKAGNSPTNGSAGLYIMRSTTPRGWPPTGTNRRISQGPRAASGLRGFRPC